METWFAAPTGGIVQPPARWKMCLMSACGIYPIITLITVLAGPLLIPLLPPARFAIVTPALSALMTWAIMPALTRLFAAFLYPHDLPRSPTHRPRSNARHAREPSAYTRW